MNTLLKAIVEVVSASNFLVFISILFYMSFLFINKKLHKNAFVNPLLWSGVAIVLLLSLFPFMQPTYHTGTMIIIFFLNPATVALAIPLYKRRVVIGKNWPALLTGAVVGVVVSLLTTLIPCKLLGIDISIAKALAPKSVTSAIGMTITTHMGGSADITVVAAMVVGIIGSVLGPIMFRLFRIKSFLARGFALGATSHVLGVTKSFDLGETAAAAASCALGLAGILGVALIPIFSKLIWTIPL